MKKSKAIGLLKNQIENIYNPEIKRGDWISNTTVLLTKIFPLSSATKIAQIKSLDNMPEFYQDISRKKRSETDKKKAENYINNYIEEIELLGTETNSKMEMFLGSFRFWSIILTICILSFISGDSLATNKELHSKQASNYRIYSLNKELLLQKKEIDSLKRIIKDFMVDI